MVNLIVTAMLATATLAAVLDALLLHYVERCCRRIEQRAIIDGDLVRWYARGFERPTELAAWLLRLCLALTVGSLMAHAVPGLAIAAAVLTGVTWSELRFGRRRRRFHDAVARR